MKCCDCRIRDGILHLMENCVILRPLLKYWNLIPGLFWLWLPGGNIPGVVETSKNKIYAITKKRECAVYAFQHPLLRLPHHGKSS